MNLIKYFFDPELKIFANSLADRLAGFYPPALENASDVSEKQLSRDLETICREAQSFSARRHLGVYGKAKLGNTFRWRLHDLGYSKKFVEMATEGLVVYMSRESPMWPTDTQSRN
jgi:hypothetical protein